MEYKEIKQDIFSLSHDYYLTQCISADFTMGKGIAVQFNKHFDIKQRLIANYGNFLPSWDKASRKGICLFQNGVFNLVTKRNHWNKPTYETLQNALDSMHFIVYYNPRIKKIAMPMIGCGLDKLDWNRVSEMIKETFSDINDLEITICML